MWWDGCDTHFGIHFSSNVSQPSNYSLCGWRSLAVPLWPKTGQLNGCRVSEFCRTRTLSALLNRVVCWIVTRSNNTVSFSWMMLKRLTHEPIPLQWEVALAEGLGLLEDHLAGTAPEQSKLVKVVVSRALQQAGSRTDLVQGFAPANWQPYT